MEAKQTRPGPPTVFDASAANAPAVPRGRTGLAHGGTLSAVGRLIERADALHLRAPELALVLGERAAALAESAGADEQWIRAESLVVSARIRCGERPGTVGRAVAALRAAEHAGFTDIAARLRIDLAVCARSLGVPLTGLAALRPVLTAPAVSAVHRAAALCHLVGCLAQIGRKSELDRVLVEADKLVLGDGTLSADTQWLVRALLRVGMAAHRRRHGDLTAAADAARTGLGFLEKLEDPADEGGLVRIRLVLMLVSTLLDRGDTEMAYEFAEPMLAEPVRAAGVAPASWLRLAVATRIHLPSGAGEAAIELVRDAVAGTDRHGLSGITARLWLELAQLEERFGRAEEAIACLYRSRAAEQLHARARRQACSALASVFGSGEPASVDLDEILRAMPRPVPAVETTAVIPPVVATPVAKPVAKPAPPHPTPPPQPPRPRVPAWSFGEREAPPAPAWSFENAPAAPPQPPPPRPAAPPPPRPAEQPAAVRRPEPVPPSVPEKPKFSWAALAQERLKETAATREPAPELPLAPAPAAEPEPRWNEQRQAEPAPTTRHDSEHGSVAARSVLDRLGIASGGGPGGGRRRAAEDEPAAQAVSQPEPWRETELAPPPRPENEPAPPLSSSSDFREEAEPFLPRLRMPPALEPIEDFGSWSPNSGPFPESYARAIAEDEPPPDAGLADLLARALAEHKAGTASAAALVKQLGNQGTTGSRRNGHGRNGSSSD